jgi:hypothetical protein
LSLAPLSNGARLVVIVVPPDRTGTQESVNRSVASPSYTYRRARPVRIECRDDLSVD